ncbi:MAG: hypothetical protein IJJ60_06290, partial [Clostridia bacterium]|nr:hypothetical protein [Clostridia bacterium]
MRKDWNEEFSTGEYLPTELKKASRFSGAFVIIPKKVKGISFILWGVPVGFVGRFVHFSPNFFS